MGPRHSAAALTIAIVLLGYLIGGGAQLSLALLTDSENDPSTFTTAASFPDTTAPTVASSVISKTTLYLPGFVRQGGTYFVYANVTDAGSGVATVRANVSTVTTGQTTLALVAGSYSIGGISYNYRSASVTANAVLAEGAKAYTITATDVATNSVTQGGFSVTVDNTRPSGTNVQTTNAGVAGQPGLGDTMTLTFSEQIDPQTVLAGWTGTSTPRRRADHAGRRRRPGHRSQRGQYRGPAARHGEPGWDELRDSDPRLRRAGYRLDDGPERQLHHRHARNAIGGSRDAGSGEQHDLDAVGHCHRSGRQRVSDDERHRGRAARHRLLESDYQFVAVEVSISPTDASQRSASMAALQPSPAAVTAWRYRWSWTSPATKTPSIPDPVSPTISR